MTLRLRSNEGHFREFEVEPLTFEQETVFRMNPDLFDRGLVRLTNPALVQPDPR
jgi:hypothetical protein